MRDLSARAMYLLCLFGIVMCVVVSCTPNERSTSQEKTLQSELLPKYAPPDRWKDDIDRFGRMDSQNPPRKNAVLFVGSSSIRMWDTKKYFPDIVTINRGFGGSYINDLVYYADKIVIPYHPSMIVFYAGDNDIIDYKTPRQVVDDFNNFVVLVHKNLPETRILYISIKPSIQRWHLWAKMKETNEMIKQYAKTANNVEFLDISEPMLGEDGRPKPVYFQADGLHLSEEGYRLWSSLLGSLIETYSTKSKLMPRVPES
jgi:lysophospholipase L1-like esterase